MLELWSTIKRGWEFVLIVPLRGRNQLVMRVLLWEVEMLVLLISLIYAGWRWSLLRVLQVLWHHCTDGLETEGS